jgi:hypothetical protein
MVRDTQIVGSRLLYAEWSLKNVLIWRSALSGRKTYYRVSKTGKTIPLVECLLSPFPIHLASFRKKEESCTLPNSSTTWLQCPRVLGHLGLHFRKLLYPSACCSLVRMCLVIRTYHDESCSTFYSCICVSIKKPYTSCRVRTRLPLRCMCFTHNDYIEYEFSPRMTSILYWDWTVMINSTCDPQNTSGALRESARGLEKS